MTTIVEKTVDLLQIFSDGTIQVREKVQVYEDNIPFAKAYHRYVLAPGDDVTGKDDRIVAAANAVWTDEVVAAYEAALEASLPGET